ncbi:hypothetical protein TTHERM_00913410 (macronuclear) [Tetrahymena thermophila SB210]|uniref:Uncharacterized protein n=1 Tax=Tetrahymena thermophila (strain SB210) TaxID=312017 RepID=Q23TT3_TETTS|nr:hypothetical protein TTHERM_00913410 [Tetrahymena thermophila SB210]EAR99962.1 hypothetical protein TTHERM_00913410 [Tetrahymena thermophila SB210]|eukprot:XP_001020207.1 hypothetical protein TTHERM_00913410 [Tetrahymena thermophila SB210]
MRTLEVWIFNIYLLKNQFQFKQVKRFILFVKDKFYQDQCIELSYRNNNLIIGCGLCQIGFDNQFCSSIFIRGDKENTYFVNIKQNQQPFIQILQKLIIIDLQNIKVELLNQNQLYASLYNGNSSSQLCLKLQFEDKADLLQFKISEHQMAEINILFKDLQFTGVKTCFLLQNIQNAYDINLNIIESNEKQQMAKIKHKLSEEIERRQFEIDFESIQDLIEIIQSYFYLLQKIGSSQNIELKLIAQDNNNEMKKNIFELINSVNFMKANITHLSLDLKFLKKNSKHFNNQKKLINLDVQFQYQQYSYQFNIDQKQMLQNFQIEKIYKDYHRLVALKLYSVNYLPSYLIQFFQKFKRLTQFNFTSFGKKYIYDCYDYGEYLYHDKQAKIFQKIYQEQGKTHFAYLFIDNHDDILCSYTRREYCTCQNNKMQKLLKKPLQFYENRVLYGSQYSSWNDD